MGGAASTRRELLTQILVFLAATTVLTTGVFIWMFGGAGGSTPAVLLMMWVPAIAALFTSLLLGDRIAEYGWKPGPVKYLGWAYVVPLAASILAYGLVWASPLAEITLDNVVHYKWAAMLGFDLPAPFLVGAASKMVLGFAVTAPIVLGEEIGWSGFLVRKLLRVTSIPTTALVVGLTWAAWHTPAIVGGLYGSGAPLYTAIPGFTLMCLGHALVKTVLLSRSQSVWVGTVLHASGNIIYMGLFWEMTVHGGHATQLLSETGVFSGLVFLGMAVLVWRIGAKPPAVARDAPERVSPEVGS